MQKNEFYIIGAGLHGRVSADVARYSGLKPIGFIDDIKSTGEIIDELPVLSDVKTFMEKTSPEAINCFIAIGNNYSRKRIFEQLKEHQFTIRKIINSNCQISPTANILEGCILVGGNMVFSTAVIEQGALIDPDVTIGAGTTVGPFSYLAPGVHTGARAKIGECAFIGLGAVILPEVTIGKNSIVGAGAVVTKDLPENVIAYGNPAKIKKNVIIDDGSHYPARRLKSSK